MSAVNSVEDRVRSLMSEFHLQDVVVLRAEGHRNYDATDRDIEEHGGEYQPSFSIALEESDDAQSFRVRVELRIKGLPFGGIASEVGLIYASGNHPLSSIGNDELDVFVNDVAFMTAYPYLRAEVGTLAAKLFGRMLTLPIVRRGEVKFEHRTHSSDAGSHDGHNDS